MRTLRDKAVEPLIETLTRSDCEGFMFTCVCQALGRIGDPRAVDPMKRALEASKEAKWILDQAKEAVETIQKRGYAS